MWASGGSLARRAYASTGNVALDVGAPGGAGFRLARPSDPDHRFAVREPRCLDEGVDPAPALEALGQGHEPALPRDGVLVSDPHGRLRDRSHAGAATREHPGVSGRPNLEAQPGPLTALDPARTHRELEPRNDQRRHPHPLGMVADGIRATSFAWSYEITETSSLLLLATKQYLPSELEV